jgi:hypothetical protein
LQWACGGCCCCCCCICHQSYAGQNVHESCNVEPALPLPLPLCPPAAHLQQEELVICHTHAPHRICQAKQIPAKQGGGGRQDGQLATVDADCWVYKCLPAAFAC